MRVALEAVETTGSGVKNKCRGRIQVAEEEKAVEVEHQNPPRQLKTVE